MRTRPNRHARDEARLRSYGAARHRRAHGSQVSEFLNGLLDAGINYIDLVQFHHSPSRRTLAEHDAVGELDDLRKEGKLRFIGMSGILPNLPEQIEMGVFDAFRSRARHSIARTRSCSLSLRRREQGRSSVAEWREVSPTGATTRSLGPAWAERSRSSSAEEGTTRKTSTITRRNGAHGVLTAVHTQPSRNGYNDRRHVTP